MRQFFTKKFRTGSNSQEVNPTEGPTNPDASSKKKPAGGALRIVSFQSGGVAEPK